MSTSEEAELKGGHPPAVKVGGMRVPGKTPHTEKAPEATETTPEEEAEYGSQAKPDTHRQAIQIAGVLTKGDKDFPPEAVQHYHNKPIPTHQNRAPVHNQQNMHIQQPRK